MKEKKQIIVINPGSTSTKAAVFMDEDRMLDINAKHSAEELGQFAEIIDQKEFRKNAILQVLKEKEIDLSKTEAFSAICTGLLSMPGGVYEVNDKMYEHACMGIGSRHPGNLGPVIAKELADEFGSRAFVVEPSSIDEFCMKARPTGMRDMFRTSRGHPLNQKEVSRRYAKSVGKPYEALNLVVINMGGGISIAAHKDGHIIDCVDSTRGEGRMAPTRSGTIPAADMVELCFSGKYTKKELLDRIMKKGGWVDWLGTSDAIEVEKRMENGDKLAKIIFETTAYQIAKDAGAMAAVLDFKVDAILITGGLAYSKKLVGLIKEKVEKLANVLVMPGEYEMEGLASGALGVLNGEIKPNSYTGEPVFTGFGSIE